MKETLKRLRERLFPSGKYSYLPYKQRGEIEFWEGIVEKFIRWYQGELTELYGKPRPEEGMKEKAFDLRENAIRTWIRVASKRYLDALAVETDYFNGCRVLDVGCGPVPHLHCFSDIERFGVDQLIIEYKELGFPMDRYEPQITYKVGSAESIPFEDNFFDAVVCVNAIDHVDDFGSVAQEIQRVLRPGGKLRMQVHSHKPRRCEPIELDDAILFEAFEALCIEKISELEVEGKTDQKLVIWSTPDEA
jgi:SAM-dependent methyltransferase